MKRIICMILMLIMCISTFCGCEHNSVIIDNQERTLLREKYVVIDKITNNEYIVFDKDTCVVYYLDDDGYGEYLCPYQIYTDSGICGAVYKDGEIQPVSYSICVSKDTIHHLINSAFGSP